MSCKLSKVAYEGQIVRMTDPATFIDVGLVHHEFDVPNSTLT